MTDKFTGYYNQLMIDGRFMLLSSTDLTSIPQWNKRKMPGLKLDWYFEDENGQRVEIVPEKK